MGSWADILVEVTAALFAAAAIPVEEKDPGRLHAARSRNFVEALADRLRATYRDDPQIDVLSKHFPGNRERFGLNELLFDILVCRTRQTGSANGSKQLTVVTAAIMAVESELARDSRQAMYDFNKLVLCSSEFKLFVGPRVANEAAFLAPLGKAAACCGGSVFAVLVPHPSEWSNSETLVVSGYRWQNMAWAALQGRGP